MEQATDQSDIQLLCRCCLTSDSTFIDMHSSKFQSHDQLLILGYKDLIGKTSSLTDKVIDDCSFICLECLEQLESAISFRELCLQAHELWSSRSGGGETSLPQGQSADATVQNEIKTTESSREGKGRKRKVLKQVYRCALCPGIYRRKLLIQEHLKEHIKNRQDPTKLCKEIFFEKYKSKYDEHNVIKCPKCGKRFRNVVELNRHVQKHIKSKPFKCSHPSCTSEFKFEKDFQDHVKIHENGKSSYNFSELNFTYFCPLGFPIKCPDCPKTFNARRSLNYHQKVHHRPETETVWHACDVCDKKFTYTAMLFEHTFLHKDHNPYHCTVCKFNTSYRTPFKRHLRKHGIEYDEQVHGYVESESHKLPKKSEGRKNSKIQSHAFVMILKFSDKSKHYCSKCCKKFSKKQSLHKHEKTVHSNDVDVKCDELLEEHNISLVMDIKIEDEEFGS
jgi:C2H2-type zinc finger/Zinc finger, C2H2 type